MFPWLACFDYCIREPPFFSLALLWLAALLVVVVVVALCFGLFLLKVNSGDEIFLRVGGCKT